MDSRILELTPKKYLCPFCGEWHEWEGRRLEDYDSEENHICLKCQKELVLFDNVDYIYIHFDAGEKACYFSCTNPCDSVGKGCGSGKVYHEEMQEDVKHARITFPIPVRLQAIANDFICTGCKPKEFCEVKRICEEGGGYKDGSNYKIELQMGFEFEPDEYKAYSVLVQQEEQRQQEERSSSQNNKEDITMGKNATTLKQQILEHSPKENFEIIKEWGLKYKNVLKWAGPVAGIYMAYQILNSKDTGINVENIEDVCEKEMGFTLDCLKNKRALKELMVLGGISAAAYGAFKAFGAIIGEGSDDSLPFEENLEKGMKNLEDTSKKFGWLQPKAEAMLPIAISVIIIFAMTNPMRLEWVKKTNAKLQVTTENWGIRLNLLFEMAKLFVEDKFNVNLFSEEDKKKFAMFALVAAIAGVLVFLYGKNILKKKGEGSKEKATNTAMQNFMGQLMELMKKLAPTAFAAVTSVLISKKMLEKEDILVLEKEPAKSADPVEEGFAPDSDE